MLVFGHQWIPSSKFIRVATKSDIEATTPLDIVLLDSLEDSHELALYLKEQHISYALDIKTIHEAIVAHNLGATYVICNPSNALEIQAIAQEYLWTMRVLVLINDEAEIESWAKKGIDGVVFHSAIL